ncbi:hypothetical protein CJO92_13145 [Ralstonia solanacearum]|uniref:Uncharacterized protein n=1 Tax=Ralstonia solanacearum TaxID=305 RepID=A0AAD0S967_RALSL|nr:hypothetical protein CJO77_13150 [Ralstonia solanacearum]AXW53512.1 hypothetical protein CJO92_13145 [Ralstonia solanacearum]
MRGSFDVLVAGSTAQIEFTEKYIGSIFLEPALKYRATVATESDDHIVLTMRRPIPSDGSGVTVSRLAWSVLTWKRLTINVAVRSRVSVL